MRVPKKILCLSFALAFSLCLAQWGFIAEALSFWSSKGDMPTARRAPAAVELDGKIYVMGGQNGKYYNVVERYDPVSDTWEMKAPMPTDRAWLVAEAVNGKIYAIGGNNPTSGKLGTVEEYDPSSNTWTMKSPMPTFRDDAVSAAVNGKIYVIGGWLDSALDVVEEYDPGTDSWTTKAPIPEGRAMAASAALNGKIYVFGGFDSGGDHKQNYEYNTNSDTWLVRMDMPTARSRTGAGVVNGRIYVVGGYNNNLVDRYDPSTNLWETITPMPTERGDIAVEVANGLIFAFGGRLAWDKPVLSVTEAGDFTNPGDSPGIPEGDNSTDPSNVPDVQDGEVSTETGDVLGAPVSGVTGDNGGGGGCFIATAAFGSPMERHVKTLCEFRDRFLLTNVLGEHFVRLYYSCSPPVANFVSKHDTLRFLVSFGLTPVVALSWVWLEAGTAIALAFLLFFTAVAGFSAAVFTRRRRKPVSARGSVKRGIDGRKITA